MFDDSDNKQDDQNQQEPTANSDDSQTSSVVTPTKDDDNGGNKKSDDNAGPVSDELLAIKRSALQELSPLLDHLDQEPDERFQTTMMMIQATDNKELIPKAYEAAKQIKEDKERAQALLDIVNEINYFTQNSHTTQSAK